VDVIAEGASRYEYPDCITAVFTGGAGHYEYP
jgi:hypothetical protein